MSIQIPEILPDVRQFLDTRELYGIVQKFLNLQLVDYDVDDLLTMEESPDEDTGKPVRNRIRYELRLTQVFFSESGLVGKCTQRQFAGILHYAYEHELGQLQKEQPGCTWQLVAAAIQRVNIHTTREVAFDGTKFNVDNLLSFVNSKDSVAIDRKIDHQQVPDYRCVVPLVFCDTARGELIDPATISDQGKEGPMTRYARTRNIRHLTDSQRKSRAAAEELVRGVAKLRDEGNALPNPSGMGAPTESSTIAELRARLAELEAREAASKRPAQEPIVAPEPVPIADELAERIVSMRIERQMTPRAIVKELSELGTVGITEDAVKAVLRRASS